MGKRKHPKISFDEPSSSNNAKHFKREIINATDAEEEEKSEIGYMQPEILPIELMKNILIGKGALETLVNEETLKGIIKLFYKYVTPKPQREYKNNRRGKFLTNLRRKKEKKGKSQNGRSWQIMDDTISSRLSADVSSKSERNTSLSPSNLDSSRLKLPVSCINLEKKKIKLSSSSGSSSLDTIQIKTLKEAPCKKSVIGDIDLSRTNETDEKNVTEKKNLKREGTTSEINEVKKIKLQRNIPSATTTTNSPTTTNTSSTSTISSAESKSPEEKRAKKAISWP